MAIESKGRQRVYLLGQQPPRRLTFQPGEERADFQAMLEWFLVLNFPTQHQVVSHRLI